MRWGGHFEAALKSIIAPGDLAERQKQPHVIALAATFRRYGGRPGNVMWVFKRRLGWELNAGRDRFAALMLNGEKRDTVREILDATPEELADLEEIENLYRRPVKDRDKLLAAHVAKLAARIETERADPGRTSAIKPKPGAPKTAVGEARDRAAAAMGTTPEAIRKVEQRVAAKTRDEEGAAHGAGAPVTSSPPPIETFGHAIPEHVADDARRVVEAMRKVDTLLRQALAAAPAGGLHVEAIERTKEAIRAAGVIVRAETPTHLCPYCKGEHVKGEPCKACNTHGYVTREVFESAPEEMRDVVTDVDRRVTASAKEAVKPRTMPVIKAGVTYAVGDDGNVVEQAPASDIDKHIARAAQAKAPARPRKQLTVNGRPLAEVIAEVEAVDLAEEDDDENGEGLA